MRDAIEYQNRFGRHPQLTILVIWFISLVLLFFIAEILFRVCGILPDNSFYKITNELIVYDMFHTDSHGVFKANVESAAWKRTGIINSSGFRGPEFGISAPGQRSILILGDSFVWGFTKAEVKTPFPELLRQTGYNVYNTGIPGVGPTQYEILANLYIPLFRPDYVIVALYLGNDLKNKPDPAMPNKNLIHITNAGWLWGFDAQDQPLTPQEAYDYYIGNSSSSIKKIFHVSSVGTALWNLFEKYLPKMQNTSGHTSDNHDSKEEKTSIVEFYAYTIQVLQRINDLAERYNSQYHLLVIPSIGKNCVKINDCGPFRSIFDKLNPIYLNTISEDCYNPNPDCHFNDKGHQFAFEQILHTIK
ncbi:hypothetical protein ACFL27_00020 [candidate division CSSED10-310 bacterium]|uniref:SGNH hydrolase-type esterase domain-containing protein n=1 Tax=candidate division CSSED10-310 bacterium TaxID=2855610 RepID=A0ABV6YQS5_UNCC1